MSDRSGPKSQDSTSRRTVGWLGLIGGPIFLVFCVTGLPEAYRDAMGHAAMLDSTGRATLGIMGWMAIWWLTEAIDLSATALLPLVLFPLFGVATMADAAAPYAHPLIFLFMGGFMLALSMRRWGLDKRIALMTLRCVGTGPMNMVAGFMLVTAVLSAFVSNTATAAMMLPIAISVISLATRDKSGDSAAYDAPADDPGGNFATCLMLGIAYSASIGGVATIIGSPPNVFLVGFLRNTIAEPYRMDFSFVRWLAIGVPLAVVLLPVVWILLTRVLYPIRIQQIPGGKQFIQTELKALGRPNRGQWATLIVFMLTATMWITRPLLVQVHWSNGQQTVYPLSGLTDSGIAMTGAMLLMIIPVNLKSREFVMDWNTAKQLPWGILVLFGGGLSLAAAVEANGVAEFVGSFARYIDGLPTFLLILLVTGGVIFLTELTSNTATTATLLPVLAAMAPALGVHPYLLVFPTAIAASCAFMLPVATPPNAIVFGSERVTIQQMMKAGIWLNIIGMVLVTVLTLLVIGPLFGLLAGETSVH